MRNGRVGVISPGTAQLPRGWPSGIKYITSPFYSKLITQEDISHLQTLVDASLEQPRVNETSTAPSKVKIFQVTDATHPANGQHALVAAKHLPADSHIIDYIGYVHNEKDTDETSDYDISLDREYSIAVDAARMGNEARFVNDYRGIRSEGPNAEFRDRWVPVNAGKGKKVWEKRVAVYVLSPGKSGKRAKGIAQGEEIVVSYGKGFWDRRREEVEADSALDAKE